MARNVRPPELKTDPRRSPQISALAPLADCRAMPKTGCQTGAAMNTIGAQHGSGLGRQPAVQSTLPVHTLWHAVAPFAVSGGASLYTVGTALGYSQACTTERYARLAQDPVR